jgi:hypothetical protein
VLHTDSSSQKNQPSRFEADQDGSHAHKPRTRQNAVNGEITLQRPPANRCGNYSAASKIFPKRWGRREAASKGGMGKPAR